MNIIRKILAVFCAAVFLVNLFSLVTFAEDANVTYTGNSGTLIFEPGSEHSPTDLFANFKNVMPGASLTQKINVKNKAKEGVKVKIYLRSLGSTDEKYNEFLNQLTLTVSKESENPMFDATAEKTAGLTDWVCLGTLYSGGDVNLNVTLDVPTTLDNMFQNKIGKIRWQFVAEEYPLEQPEWDSHKDSGHSYHIEEDEKGIAEYVCDDCKKKENLYCDVCGGKMKKVIVIMIGGKTYVAYSDGDKHYVTEDGSAHFYFNDDEILDYYIVNGKKINVKSVSEYTIYTYYECLNSKRHHTDPIPSPKTGDHSHLAVRVALAAVSGSALVILLILKRKKDNDEEVKAQC